MADRVLTWHISGALSETGVVGTNVSTEFTLDRDYQAEKVLLRLKTEGEDDNGGCLAIDINDDGTSIFDLVPALNSHVQSGETTGFDNALEVMEKDSVITLDVDEICQKIAGEDLTVELFLNAA